MLFHFLPPVCASLLFSTTFSFPSAPTFLHNVPGTARNVLLKRGEPTTWDDLPDSNNHPNQLDQVETAFKDALELAAYAVDSIDSDTTIFPNYFDEGDKAGVKNVFLAILGDGGSSNPEGNDLLGNLHVQTTDTDNLCDGRTLAYTNGHDTNSPYIVLCPNAFKKKAVTALNGAPNPSDNPDDAKWYIGCDELTTNGHVSYLMNSLGATLLHEYTHYDGLVQSIFGAEIIDQANPNGYGAVNVYNNLPKSLSPFNADSYMYYALASLTRCFTRSDSNGIFSMFFGKVFAGTLRAKHLLPQGLEWMTKIPTAMHKSVTTETLSSHPARGLIEVSR